jgi:hypothetical protein
MGQQSARIAAALTAKVQRAAQALVLQIDRELRMSTPVDTGHARRNWVPSVGEPSTGEVADESAHAAGIAAVMAYKLGSGALWVSNGVPYIRALNYGHSQQAPAGFVEAAIDRAMSAVRAKHGEIAELQQQFRSEMGAQAADNIAAAYSPFGDD